MRQLHSAKLKVSILPDALFLGVPLLCVHLQSDLWEKMGFVGAKHAKVRWDYATASLRAEASTITVGWMNSCSRTPFTLTVIYSLSHVYIAVAPYEKSHNTSQARVTLPDNE